MTSRIGVVSCSGEVLAAPSSFSKNVSIAHVAVEQRFDDVARMAAALDRLHHAAVADHAVQQPLERVAEQLLSRRPA